MITSGIRFINHSTSAWEIFVVEIFSSRPSPTQRLVTGLHGVVQLSPSPPGLCFRSRRAGWYHEPWTAPGSNKYPMSTKAEIQLPPVVPSALPSLVDVDLPLP